MSLAAGELQSPQRPLCFVCDLLSRLRSPHLRVIALAPCAIGHRRGDFLLLGGVVAVSKEDYSTVRYYKQVLFRAIKHFFDFFSFERYYIPQKGGQHDELGQGD
jgi:hypothetical protein